jgi:DNA helicase II / ATP-dependent DNA helicase PcrA
MNASTGTSVFPLESMTGDELQSLYEKGRRGELTCPVCGEPVRVKIGIHEAPYYLHRSASKTDCRGQVKKPITTIENKIEFEGQNGFRIPKSRNITEPQEPNTTYKNLKMIKSTAPFTKRASLATEQDHTYFSLLSQQGVTLDENQMAAATSIDGPLLVLSGAGSGKTRVLTVRTAFMIAEHNIDPKSIMLVTFTAKAAAEMKQRLLSYPGVTAQTVNRLVCGTFHSIFYRILIFHEPDKWQRNLLLKWDWEKEKIIRDGGREIGINEKEFAYDQALQQIGFWKNSLTFPEDVRPPDEWETSCAFLYKKYEEYKKSNDKYDFDDMLTGCYLLLRDNEELLNSYQQRFRYFLVDEFQDINKVQFELIKLLSSETNNVCVVGDDDQAIYSFRGSDPSFILNFTKDYPDSRIVKLTENYRSSHEIVSVANQVIKRNVNRMKKTMRAQYAHGISPIIFYPYDEEIEATMILTDIQDKIANGASPGDFAVLYRTHSMSRAIFERFAASNIPFSIERNAEPFYERKIVKGMLAFLRLCVNPHDQKAAADILASLFLKQNVLQDMKAHTILQDCDFIDSFGFIKTGHAFQEKKLKTLPKQLRSLNDVRPSIALEIIEKELGFQDYVKKRGNEGSIDKGSDDIRDLKVAAKRFATNREFIEHVDHMTAKNKEIKQLSGTNQEAVQLTTIHRSKGLEYNNVYVLATVDGSIPHDFALDSYRKGDYAPLEEERRLLYVAATRAKENLYLSVPQTRRGRIAHPSKFLTL